MKFDKFGVFPKTDAQKNESKNNFDLSALLKLLPSLFSNKKSEQQKEQPPSPKQEPVYKPSNKDAYAEYVAKHDEFVKNSKIKV